MPSLKVHFYLTVFLLILPFVLNAADIGNSALQGMLFFLVFIPCALFYLFRLLFKLFGWNIRFKSENKNIPTRNQTEVTGDSFTNQNVKDESNIDKKDPHSENFGSNESLGESNKKDTSTQEESNIPEQPDEIDEQIDDLDDEVWDRGYKCQTADGVWYEVFVNDTIKSIHPDINTENEPYDAIFSGYKGLMLDFYDDYGQITFFVPNGESEKTLEALTEYFI